MLPYANHMQMLIECSSSTEIEGKLREDKANMNLIGAIYIRASKLSSHAS